MKKLIKWILGISITLVVLIAIAAVILPMVIDPNDYKDTIENKVKDQIGRSIHLDGDIQWKVFPWLALTLNDVKVDNAKGFKGQSLAEIKKLTAQVKILPLLSKNIEIGRVGLEGADINLQITKKGNSNWQSILTALNSGESVDSTSEQDSSSGSGSLNIAGIDLKNINLNYNDLQSNTKAVVSEFNLSTGEITETAPVKLDTSMHLVMPDTGLNVDISAVVMAKNLLKGSGLVVDINDLSVKGKMSAQSDLPLEVSFNQAGVINFDKDTLDFPKILLSLGDAKVATNVSGKNISKSTSELSGSYQIDTFNLNEFLKKMTGAYFVTNDTFDNFKSSGTWNMGANSMELTNLNMGFADTVIEGAAHIKNLEKMSGKFNLHINKLNIDAFLGDEETAQSSGSSSSSTPDIDFGHMRGSVTIDKLTASGATLENLKVTVNTNGAKMVLAPIKANFYKGFLITAIKINTKATKNKVIVEHNMNKIHAGPLITDLVGSEMLTGIGDLKVNINIDKPFSDVPLKSAHGNIKYSLGDGAIYGVDVFGMMQKGLSMIYPELKQTADDGVKKTSFALMQLDADIDKGILTTNKLNIESPYLKVNGDLVIDLVNMTIKGTIEPMLLDIPDQLVSDKYKKLLNIAIPVSLSGSLTEPNISIDAKKLILATQKERINKQKDKLKGKLMDSLFGKKKNKSDDKNQENKEKPESNKDKAKNKLKDLFGGG